MKNKYNMHLKHIFILVALCLISIGSMAQTTKFLDRLRSNEDGRGKVTVVQSADIDVLVNGNPGAATTAPSQKPVTKEENTTRQEHNRPATPDISRETSSPFETINEDTYVDTRKKVMRNSYKTTGFRIQVFSGGNSRNDRQKAEKAGYDVKRLFPNEPIYVHFYSPSWKCRMGNYRSQEEAQQILQQVKKIYPQACIVKGTISVQY